MKYLLVIAVVAIFYMYWKKQRRSVQAPPKDASRHAVEHMVACTHCGVHLPAQDALHDSAQHPYCSDAHRRLGPPR